jgi:hypothetical protein
MPDTRKSYLDLLLDPVTESFTPDVARRVVGLQADPNIQVRIGELAEKANEGTLSEEERAEYLEFIEAADLVAIIQAKARKRLS